MMYDDYVGTELLVVFDQHAAHERVRLEQFTKGTLLVMTVIFI